MITERDDPVIKVLYDESMKFRKQACASWEETRKQYADFFALAGMKFG